jgi:hypothetical protein
MEVKLKDDRSDEIPEIKESKLKQKKHVKQETIREIIDFPRQKRNMSL